MPILQLVSVVVALLLGLIVVMRNYGDRNRWFLLLFNTSVSIWIVSYLLADLPIDYSLFWNRATFVCALLMTFTGYLLVASLSNRLNLWAFMIGVLFAAWSVVILFTPFIVDDIVPRIGGSGIEGFDVIRGEGYPSYVASVAVAGGAVLAFTLYLMRKSRGRFRAQLRLIVGGYAGVLVTGLITGVALPLVLQSSEPANYSFIGTFVIMGAFAYAIVQQRFFDLRLAVARSLGYFITLSIITVFYVVAAFAVADLLFSGQGADVGVRIYYIVAAIIVALTFQPLKQFISHMTRRIFFYDTYETQEVFDRLTSILVGTVETKALTTRSAQILKEAMRVEFLKIVLIKKESKYDSVLAKLGNVKDWPAVTDELALQRNKLANALYESNIALVSRIKTHTELVGYIVCGPKLRGDVLTNQDTELIRVAGDELAVAIQNALRFEEIMHFNETLRQEVAEATAQLRQSNKKLHKLDEAKDEFISMASHQLRTPLTSVKGYLSMALEGDAGELTQPQRKLLEEAFTSAQRMVYLIGDFLNVSRLQTGKFMLEPKSVSLAEVVSQEISQLQATAARRNIKLEYDKPIHFPIAMLDEDKIRQVIMNFLDNAIFYSHPGGKVAIELIATGKELRLTVRDNGIGVPVSERHKLFDKFFRAENARKVRPDGTGIGLFMAKKVVTAHGGSMIFESQLGKGSVFGFSLPQHALRQQTNKLEK